MKNDEYLIDTDIIIDFLNGRHNLTEKIKDVGLDNCFVSEITISELYYGAYKSNQQERRIKEVDDLVDSISIIPITEFLKNFGFHKAKLSSTGQLIGDFDIYIAITALKRDLVLVTGNEKHHKRITGIRIENWRKAEFNKYV